MEKKNKMKKIFKNFFIFSLICVFSSCEFFTDSFNAPVKDFFMDNTEAAAIELFEFSSETYKNSITEKLTVSSLQDANVVLYLRNPQEYNFITSKNMKNSTFSKTNYIIIGIAIFCIVLGFVLMHGSTTTLEFNPEVFSFQRVTLAPTIALGGFILMIFGILYKKK